MTDLNNSYGISDNDVKKTKEYAAALDKLNESLKGINSSLPSFTDGLEAGLKGIADKLPDVVDAMMRISPLAGASVSRRLKRGALVPSSFS